MEQDYGGSYKHEANPLDRVGPAYFLSTESANLSETEGHVEGIAFAEMADYEGQGRRVNRNTHPVAEFQRLAWENW